jgi:hypothetical protein
VAKEIELRRHTDADEDVLTAEGVAAALAIGAQLRGHYRSTNCPRAVALSPSATAQPTRPPSSASPARSCHRSPREPASS